MLGLPDTQVWRVELSCHCPALLIDGGRGPDLSRPWICPNCQEIGMAVNATRYDEVRRNGG